MNIKDVLIKKEVELLEICSSKYSNMLKRIISKFTTDKNIINDYSNLIEGITWSIIFVILLTIIIRAF